jgi:hypothetical protein
MASSDGPGRTDREVLSSLPNTRPQQRSAKRDARTPRKPAKAAKPRPKAAPKPPPVPPAGYATPRSDDAPDGADLLATAVRAAGELAQIGIAAGGRALKAAVQRLPRP